MKKFFVLAIAALMSLSISAKTLVKSGEIAVEHTFSVENANYTVYYVKHNDGTYKVYSDQNLDNLGVTDLYKLTETTGRRVNYYDGTLRYNFKNTKSLISYLKKLVILAENLI